MVVNTASQHTLYCMTEESRWEDVPTQEEEDDYKQQQQQFEEGFQAAASDALPYAPQRWQLLRDIINIDIEAAHAKWSAFAAAVLSASRRSCVDPFPHNVLADGPCKCKTWILYDTLEKDIKNMPAMKYIELIFNANSYTSISPNLFELLYWALVSKYNPYLHSIRDSSILHPLLETLYKNSAYKNSVCVFEICYITGTVAELQFEQRAQQYYTHLAFHGCKLDQTHSILHYGFQKYKYVCGIRLTNEFSTALKHAPICVGRSNILYGLNVRTVIACELIEDAKLVHIKRPCQCEYPRPGCKPNEICFKVMDTKLLRPRYLLFFNETNEQEEGEEEAECQAVGAAADAKPSKITTKVKQQRSASKVKHNSKKSICKQEAPPNTSSAAKIQVLINHLDPVIKKVERNKTKPKSKRKLKQAKNLLPQTFNCFLSTSKRTIKKQLKKKLQQSEEAMQKQHGFEEVMKKTTASLNFVQQLMSNELKSQMGSKMLQFQPKQKARNKLAPISSLDKLLDQTSDALTFIQEFLITEVKHTLAKREAKHKEAKAQQTVASAPAQELLQKTSDAQRCIQTLMTMDLNSINKTKPKANKKAPAAANKAGKMTALALIQKQMTQEMQNMIILTNQMKQKMAQTIEKLQYNRKASAQKHAAQNNKPRCNDRGVYAVDLLQHKPNVQAIAAYYQKTQDLCHQLQKTNEKMQKAKRAELLKKVLTKYGKTKANKMK